MTPAEPIHRPSVAERGARSLGAQLAAGSTIIGILLVGTVSVVISLTGAAWLIGSLFGPAASHFGRSIGME